MRPQYLFVLCLGAFTGLAAEISTVEEIVAKVNGDIVTRTELERGKRQLEATLRERKLPAPQLQQALKEGEGNILRERIDQLLLVQRAKELNISVEAEVSKQLAEIQKTLKIADPDKFQQAVKDQLGIPYEDYKNEIRNSMMTERVVRQEVGGMINIPRAELQKYYDEHKNEFVREERVFLREIFLSLEGKDAAAQALVEKKAKDIVSRARKGEKFPELARDNSDNAQTAQSGGDIGAWKKGDLAKNIEDIVFDKDRNYVTDPIKVGNGFLILKVEERHVAGLAKFEDVEQEITGRIYNERFQPKIREFLTQLRSTAFLEIKEGYVDAGAAPGKDTAWKDPAQLKPETVTKEEVAARPRHKKLLWVVPIPGTKTSSSTSKAATMK